LVSSLVGSLDESDNDEVQRPAHVIIATLNDMDDEWVEYVSEPSLKLKALIKVPMVLCTATSALQSGITIVMLKLFSELGQTSSISTHWLLAALMLLAIGASGAVQLHMLNLAMKYYNQIEVIPIYSTAIMVIWIATGMVVFNEARFYSTLELFGIAGSILSCVIGIKFLTMKTKMLEAARLEEKGKLENGENGEDEEEPATAEKE
jgi:hypothetical protein